MFIKNILFIEPFYKGSHKYFVERLKSLSKHNITIASRNGVFWKWKFMESSLHTQIPENHNFDIIMGSNMLDLSSWAGINRKLIKDAKLCLYFHENQLTYPENKEEKRTGEFFGYMNLTSSFCADKVFFNSEFHMNSFISAGEELSRKLPDNIPTGYFQNLRKKSSIVPVGIETDKLLKVHIDKKNEEPIVLWNHRWEFDKNPELFLRTLIKLKDQGITFKLLMLGMGAEKTKNNPFFLEAKEKLQENILQWGSVESAADYMRFLWQADILPVTSFHDFFGVSVLEAVLCHTVPLLPKRCAYPEHFPVNEFGDYYYEDEEDFFDKLKQMLLLTKTREFNTKLSDKVLKYDWSFVVKTFDEEISKL